MASLSLRAACSQRGGFLGTRAAHIRGAAASFSALGMCTPRRPSSTAHLTGAGRCRSLACTSSQQLLQASTQRATHFHNADVTLHCRGSDVLAHSSVLCMASPVWKGVIDGLSPGAHRVQLTANSTCIYTKAEVAELLLCHLYPIHPRPAISWDNVEELTKLAHEWQVACVLSACQAFLLGCTFDTAAKPDGSSPPWQEARHAMHWLQLSDALGMEAVIDRCIARLLDGTKKTHAFCVDRLGTGRWATVIRQHVVHEQLQAHLMNDVFLSSLTAPTLRKLVKALAAAS